MADPIEKDTVSVYFVRAAVSHLTPQQRVRSLAVAGIPAELLDSGLDWIQYEQSACHIGHKNP